MTSILDMLFLEEVETDSLGRELIELGSLKFRKGLVMKTIGNTFIIILRVLLTHWT